jgi:hypothetical protein
VTNLRGSLIPSIRLIYTESREPTSGLEPLTCSLRVIAHALQGVAEGCKYRISKLLSLLQVAGHCTVLRSQWYQSGINIALVFAFWLRPYSM